jgi:hypothetical protein
MGLALLHPASGEGPEYLAYLTLWPRESYELERRGVRRPPPESRERGRLHEWRGMASLSLLLGEPPLAKDAAYPEEPPALPLPLATRELGLAHRFLTDGAHSIKPWGTSLALYCDDRRELFCERNGGKPPSRFVLFTGDGAGNGEAFDLDLLDERGDPVVRSWDHETWEAGAALAFWDWFEEAAPSMLLHRRSW